MSRENLQKLFLAGILLGVPLYQKFPLLEVPGTFVRIRIEDFLIFFISIYVAVHYLPRLNLFFKKSLERSIILFWIVGLVSLVSAIFVTKTVIPHIGFLHWARRVEYMIVVFFALSLIKSKSRDIVDFTVKLLLIATFAVFIYGVGQKYFHWPVIITQNEQYSKGIALRFVPGAHLTSTFAGHYDLASFMVLVLPVFVASFFVIRGRISKFLLFTAVLVGLWVLANTLSRTSVVSYFFAVGLALFLIKKYKEIVAVFLVSLVVFSFSSNLFDRYLRIIEVARENLTKIMFVVPAPVLAQTEPLPSRISSQSPTPTPIAVFEDRSTSIRFNVEWPRAIRAFKKNPILGTGYSSITLATDNDYLRALGEIGILGMFSFLLVIALVFLEVRGVYPLTRNFTGLELGFAAGVVGATVGVLVNAVFIDVFESSKLAIIFWLMIGILVCLVRSEKYQKNA
ncbi:hypothetical protein A2125_00315 [Candidatus Woesebacteria bacterium GWB1_43_5]|uniref:O-antigen ligase-related domain-containing protein n=1 Tax=Candidatus Woesebacteria bacterium GWB1_43_5 TaxID=1802474 RepID=A0A1F7WRS9_9BACT|nr:MAG: hypothetical protein A2125_00315 [Candidatus Woesebacteria bacterium GWB1_43_5]